ncbi:piggyBac transposable element-derived protein 4-like [Zophobas morio]|uniref:piggyBac transposable element-derived protein 4-like n=1 Tax=Zophobas morio TaxID=2755281 RepID=UPI003082D3AE
MEFDIWKHFFSDKILDCIVKNTNDHIRLARANYTRERDAKETDILEVQALLGLLYLAGVLKSSRLNVEELRNSNGTGVEIFRLTTSQSRFRFLLQHLRFDDMTTREVRKKLDKLAPIREIFDNFVTNCKTAYTPFEYVTIDEKLEAFRGRCAFKQYIPNKPNKYGIKIFALVDAKTFYTSNLEVYAGKQPDGPFAVNNSPNAAVQRLCQPIKGTGRNVTLDNWFTSIDLLDTLYKNFNLTLLGTIRKNKKELPIEFSRPFKRPALTSMFGFRENATLVSYMSKKNKNVLLVSSMHHDDCIDRNTNKPDMIMDYNATKGGVDSVDKLCAAYDCARNTRRWPMVVFYSLLNIAGINSLIIYSMNNNIDSIKRREFSKRLSFHLIESHMRRRAMQGIPRTMAARICEILGTETPQSATSILADHRGRYTYCDRRKNRPTRINDD